MAVTRSVVEIELALKGAAAMKTAMASIGGGISNVSTFFARYAAAAAAAAGAMAAMTGRAIKHADELGKAAQRAGLTAEAYSALAHAADLADVSGQSLQTGIKKLSETMVAAAGGNREARTTFEELGVAFADGEGKARAVDEVMIDLAGRFASMENGAERVALATKLFGKSGQDLLPMMASGKDGLLAMTQEARELGLVVGSGFAANAEEFMDNLSRVKKLFEGVFLQVADKLLPALNGLLKFGLDWLKAYTPVQTVLSFLTDGFTRLAKSALTAWYGLEQIGTFFAVFGTDLALTLDPAEAWNAALAEMAKNAERYGTALARINGIEPPGAPKAAGEGGHGGPIEITKSAPLGKTLEQDLAGVRFAQEAVTKAGGSQIEQREILHGLYAKERELLDGLAYRADVGVENSRARLDETTDPGERKKVVDDIRQAEGDQLAVQKEMFDLSLKQRDLDERGTFMGSMIAGIRDLQASWQGLGATLGNGVIGMITEGVQGLAGALTAVIMGTKSAGAAFGQFAIQMLTSFIGMIVQAILWATVAIPILTALGVLTAGSTAATGAAATTAAVATSIAAVGGMTGRATGGSVIGGMPYVVGERRPELFIPETSGRIVPQVDAAGMGPGNGGQGQGSRTVVYVVANHDEALKDAAQRGVLNPLIVNSMKQNRTRFGMKG